MALVGAGMVMAGVSQTAIAAPFDQREVDQNRLIAIAAPAGQISHQLLILEQIGSRRCWEEEGDAVGTVDPLLLDFDFTGICGRSTDSNGYSVRVAGQDLALDYSLRIQERDDELVLVAVSNRDRTAPALEIGHTAGVSDGFLRIELNPGWRMTKRAYEGQVLSHIYLTHDSDLGTLVAAASDRPMATRPSTSSTTVSPSDRISTSSTVITTPTDVPRISTSPSTSSDHLARVTIPSTSSTPATTSSAAINAVTYRVVVDANSSQLDDIKAIVPDAFRTTVDGQSVVQAGIFRDRSTAESIRETLSDRDFQARILTIPAGTLVVSRSPSTVSSRTPVVTSRTNDDLPDLSNSRLTVVLDPGHGGRDPGAVGINGLQEADVVLDITEKVADILEDQGVNVVMTRVDDREIDLAPRVSTAERANATAFVSIHANALSLSRPEVNGVETYYSSSSSLGRQLAQSIQENLVDETDMGDRGTKTARFYVLTQTSMPAALVEVGFVTGEEDAPLLASSAFRSRIADGIGRGILDYLQGR